MFQLPLADVGVIRTLVFTTLYPNREQPSHGIFVENRLRHVLRSGRVEAQIVAPVPYFPFGGAAFGRYGALARVPRHEVRHGVEVWHPRFAVVPKIGMRLGPLLLDRSGRAAVSSLSRRGFDFDLIDAHYFYPDGVAAARMAEALRKPLVITARGTDINLIAEFPGPRRQILWAAERADQIVTVCQALKDRLVELGVVENKIRVLRNGVDLAMFAPVDRTAARGELGLTRRTLVSVGHLIERKGHDLVIRALAKLADIDLLIVGDGPEESRLRALAHACGVADRVRFLGRVLHEELPAIYTAVDALVLASSREGWANVLLEAMACGTPVVATDVWGTREVVTDPVAGKLVGERTESALADAIGSLLRAPPDRAATRAYAEGFGWEPTTQGQLDIFDRLARADRASRRNSGASVGESVAVPRGTR